jgi:hypothetical protein
MRWVGFIELFLSLLVRCIGSEVFLWGEVGACDFGHRIASYGVSIFILNVTWLTSPADSHCFEFFEVTYWVLSVKGAFYAI